MSRRKPDAGTSVLQIPNYIIRNEEDCKLTASGFSLYAYMKHLYYLNGKDANIEVQHAHIMGALGVNDLRTFKKMLNELYENGLIMEKIETFPKRNTITLPFKVIECEERFAQLPTALLQRRINEVGHIGFRLLYYYESYINRSTQIGSKAFSFASFKQICGALGISQVSLAKYNGILVEEKLLKITKHKLSTDLAYNDSGKLMYDKYNNHYFPQIERMK